MTVKLIYPDNKQTTYCFIDMLKVDNDSITLYFEKDDEPIELKKTQRIEFKIDNDPTELTI